MSEWLDNIKNQLGRADKFLNENGNQAVEVTVSVMNKLIQQAERAEELERRKNEIYKEAYEQGVFDARMYDYYEKPKLEKQNKRYREAMTKAMKELDTPGMTKINAYRTLNFALEGESE